MKEVTVENQDLYQRLKEPFETREEAVKNMHDFCAAIEEARVAFRIPHVIVAMHANTKAGLAEGGESPIMTLRLGTDHLTKRLIRYLAAVQDAMEEQERQELKALAAETVKRMDV